MSGLRNLDDTDIQVAAQLISKIWEYGAIKIEKRQSRESKIMGELLFKGFNRREEDEATEDEAKDEATEDEAEDGRPALGDDLDGEIGGNDDGDVVEEEEDFLVVVLEGDNEEEQEQKVLNSDEREEL